MTAVSSGRVYQPVDYQPHPSSITHPTHPRSPIQSVFDYRTDRSTITDPTRQFTLPEFSRIPEFLFPFSSTNKNKTVSSA
jgi:hypothetical protein